MDLAHQSVNGVRTYDSTGRQQQSDLRRRAVLQAALELISDNGYVATTMTAIAQRAGTSVEFVYKHFGDKTNLVRHVLDFALAGDDEPVPMNQRPQVLQMMAESDARVVLASYAQFVASTNARVGGFLLAVAAAAPTNSQLTALWVTAQQQRLKGTRAMLRNVATKTELSLTLSRGTDIVWALIGPELHRLLVVERGWSAKRYSAWIRDTLIHELIPAEV